MEFASFIKHFNSFDDGNQFLLTNSKFLDFSVISFHPFFPNFVPERKPRWIAVPLSVSDRLHRNWFIIYNTTQTSHTTLNPVSSPVKK